jgi:Xaa-Pro dipeptidase
LHNGTVAEFEAAHIGSVFMPHGLGHLIGLDTHDTSGYPEGCVKSKEPGLCWLRCGRTLEPGMVISVEPGCYFNDKWINRALANPTQAKYINSAVLDGYRGSGGCRLEDDVLITATGIENLTIAPARYVSDQPTQRVHVSLVSI